jgi:hypothetical protein
VSATVPTDRIKSSSGDVDPLSSKRRSGSLDVFLLSAWCGLAGGLLEVGTRILCRYIDPTNRLYVLSRHFVWLVPLSNLVLLSGVGTFLALGNWTW